MTFLYYFKMLSLQNLFLRKKKLYFLHIPKTAGTSVSNVLSQIAEKKDLNMVGPILIDHLIERPNWEKSDLLIGHLGLLPLDHNFQYFTILRDPLERLYSYYSHVKRDPIYYHHKIVSGENLNFEEFLLDDRFYNINFNMQTRYLSTVPNLEESGREMIFAQKAYDFENSAIDNVSLGLALSTLEKALWVGDANNLSQLGRLLEKRLDFPNIDFPFLNVDPGIRKEFSPLEIEAAKPLIELDTVIYQRWKSPIQT